MVQHAVRVPDREGLDIAVTHRRAAVTRYSLTSGQSGTGIPPDVGVSDGVSIGSRPWNASLSVMRPTTELYSATEEYHQQGSARVLLGLQDHRPPAELLSPPVAGLQCLSLREDQLGPRLARLKELTLAANATFARGSPPAIAALT